MDEPDDGEPPDALVSRDRHQEAEDGVDQHAHAQEVDATVFLRQEAERNLGDDVAVEEGAQDVALGVGFPREGTVGARIRRGVRRSLKQRLGNN